MTPRPYTLRLWRWLSHDEWTAAAYRVRRYRAYLLNKPKGER